VATQQNRWWIYILVITLSARAAAAQGLSEKEQLGKRLFFDQSLSTPPGQACAVCHGPEVGFTGPDEALNKRGGVYEGAVHGRFGNRKPPSSAYAGASPLLHYDEKTHTWVGGMFWDGRATGEKLKDPLAEQAQGPFLNPLEQNNPDAKDVVLKVSKAPYADLFQKAWGAALDPKDAAGSYERIARSISEYERSKECNPYTSKYDLSLKGKAKLSDQEELGRKLFVSKGLCANCHTIQPGPKGEPPLFTDFTYENLGTPKNPDNPFYTMPAEYNPDGRNWIDEGLGGYLRSAGRPPKVWQSEIGKHKVPTLRNVDLRPKPEFIKCYGHNGFFKSLEQVVHFYNTRDTGKWPPPEVAQNVNKTELGNLRLTAAEEAAVVAFLKTLSDGYAPGR
jgi:cytochrome c peroxidase